MQLNTMQKMNENKYWTLAYNFVKFEKNLSKYDTTSLYPHSVVRVFQFSSKLTEITLNISYFSHKVYQD